MGHCIHAIIAPRRTADAIAIAWPALPRLDNDNGFSTFPVDVELIDARIAPDATPTITVDGFMLLTGGFLSLLQELSHDGQLAYIETEYFGGKGGQGALVFRDGIEMMPPTWREADTINDALRLIEISRSSFADEFMAGGLGLVRSNDDIIEQIACWNKDA
ncbi:MAG: hypothetical protein U1A77_26415 [Pirellulales bacterium]